MTEKFIMRKNIDAEKPIAEVGNIIPLHIPSVLDEAAEKYSENILANNEDLQDAIEDAFKAGAEWMAGRGVNIRGRVLPLEQPDNEDIDKVAQELYEHLYELKRRNNVPTNLFDKQEIIALWKAGIEYAYNHPKQEQTGADLEKAFAHEYAIYHLPNFIIASIVDGTELIDFIYNTARHFYELGLNAKER